MSYFNIVASTNENTVVTEYEPVKVRADPYQSEAALEKEFIRLLCEQGYLVFADVVWDQIETDEDGNTNYYNLPDPTFDVFVCPSCGRLMVFGDSNRCTFYKREDE